jgi:hypothetical protein
MALQKKFRREGYRHASSLFSPRIIPYYRSFTAAEFEVIQRGHEAMGMDERWAIAEEDGIIYFYRSWTRLLFWEVHGTAARGGFHTDELRLNFEYASIFGSVKETVKLVDDMFYIQLIERNRIDIDSRNSSKK